MGQETTWLRVSVQKNDGFLRIGYQMRAGLVPGKARKIEVKVAVKGTRVQTRVGMR